MKEKVPLNEPADSVSSLVCVDKPDGSIRVRFDPRDLNAAIKREHYPLPLIDDITTTLLPPFGRYRYLRMPKGIKSASEVSQQRMEQVFESLKNCQA